MINISSPTRDRCSECRAMTLFFIENLEKILMKLPQNRRASFCHNNFQTFKKEDLSNLKTILEEEKKSNICNMAFLRNPTTTRDRWMLVGVLFSKTPSIPEGIKFSKMKICHEKYYII